MLQRSFTKILRQDANKRHIIHNAMKIEVKQYHLGREMIKFINTLRSFKLNNTHKFRCGYITENKSSTLSNSFKRIFSEIRFVNNSNCFTRLYRRKYQNGFVRLYDKVKLHQGYLRGFVSKVRQILEGRYRRSLMLSATGVYNNGSKEETEKHEDTTSETISDSDLEELKQELSTARNLCLKTVYCTQCKQRRIIDVKQAGITYCSCKGVQSLKDAAMPSHDTDGWVPYMEAKDVIIWRKEYKPGQRLYAYKVYGKYPEVCAQDFVAVQMDGTYRRAWDQSAVAVTTLEENVAGVRHQSVVHWEVLWPRLFANRDYVYVRRHKRFRPENHGEPSGHTVSAESDNGGSLVVIASKACEHPARPEARNAIRVSEYWSHMVVLAVNGDDSVGLEFVLTYYDEPAVGGMPSSVASWATGRAAPDFFQRMRRAAQDYQHWRRNSPHTHTQLVEFPPDDSGADAEGGDESDPIDELDMESSRRGPIITDERTQVEDEQTTIDAEAKPMPIPKKIVIPICTPIPRKENQTDTDEKNNDIVIPICTPIPRKNATDKNRGDTNTQKMDQENSGNPDDAQDPQSAEDSASVSWWRYLHPYYYFA